MDPPTRRPPPNADHEIRDVFVTIRLTPTAVKWLDDLAEREGKNRSDMARALMTRGAKQ